MGQTNTSSRRRFIQRAILMLVLSTMAPSLVLSSLGSGSSSGERSTRTVASYTLKLRDYPALKRVGGSVRLTSAEQLALNPDQLDNTPNANNQSFPIAITHVSIDGSDAFVAVSTLCPDRSHLQVAEYDPATGRFVCRLSNASFAADGSPIPASASAKSLRAFETTYDEFAGTVTIVGVATSTSGAQSQGEAPKKLFLDQNYPNPYNPTTMIRYGLPAATHVKLTIYSLLGTPIQTLVDQESEAGTYIYDFSAKDLPSGAYFYRLETGLGSLTRRMIVQK